MIPYLLLKLLCIVVMFQMLLTIKDKTHFKIVRSYFLLWYMTLSKP